MHKEDEFGRKERFVDLSCRIVSRHVNSSRWIRLIERRSYCLGRYLLPHLRLMIIDPSLFFYSALHSRFSPADRILATCNESSTRQALALK